MNRGGVGALIGRRLSVGITVLGVSVLGAVAGNSGAGGEEPSAPASFTQFRDQLRPIAPKRKFESVDRERVASALEGLGTSLRRIARPNQSDIVAAERQEHTRDSPAAIEGRAASETAYKNLSTADAWSLTKRLYGDQIISASSTPSEQVAGIPHVSYLSERVARIPGDGTSDPELLVSAEPLRAVNQAGKLAPVDLSLESAGAQWAPVNGVAESSIPAGSAGTISVGDIEFRATDDETSSLGLGESARFFANVDVDTDMTLSSTTKGVEVFFTLRSPASPREQAIDFGRQHQSLRLNSDGSVSILNANKAVAGSVSPATAIDAQGQPVDVKLGVSGDILTITTDPGNQEVTYPVLVDPLIDEEQIADSDLGEIRSISDALDPENTEPIGGWYASDPETQNGDYALDGPSGRGLYAFNGYSPTGPLSAGWIWIPPGPSTTLSQFEFGPFNLNLNGDTYSNAGGNLVLGAGGPGAAWGQSFTEDVAGGYETIDNNDQPGLNFPMPMALFALLRFPPNFSITTIDHDAFLGGGVARYGDPTGSKLLGDLGAFGYGTTDYGWINDPEEEEEVPMEAEDDGVGVKTLKITAVDSEDNEQVLDIYEDSCDGSPGNPCPNELSNNLTIDLSSLDDGQYTIKYRAYDALGQTNGGPNIKIGIDRELPDLASEGPLTDESDPLVARASHLSVVASDALSGPAAVDLSVDGQSVDSVPQDCGVPASCDIDGSLTIGREDLDAGAHSFTLTAADVAGNVSDMTGNFTLDPTDPELTLDGDLAAADEQPLSAGTYDLEIGGADGQMGDSGIRSASVAVDGENVFSASEDCSSGCPAASDQTFVYDTANYGEGPHSVVTVVSDDAGNSVKQILRVDVPPPAPEAVCPTTTPAQDTSHDVLGDEDAKDGAPGFATEPSVPASEDGGDSQYNPRLVQFEPAPEPLEISGSKAAGKVGTVPAGGFSISHEICFMPTRTTTDETAAAITHESDSEAEGEEETVIDAALFSNAHPDTDVVVRPTAVGLTAFLHRRGSQAPTTFSWDVGVADGLDLEVLTDGSIAVVDNEKEVSGIVVPTRPIQATDPEYSSDVATQLADGEYQIKQAEDETGVAVYTVIPPPTVVDDSGNVTQASLSLSGSTIQVSTGVDNAGTIVIPILDDNFYIGPNKESLPMVRSHYFGFISPNAMSTAATTIGCSESRRMQPGLMGMLILDFGTPRIDARGVYTGSNFLTGTTQGKWETPISNIRESLRNAAKAKGMDYVGGNNCMRNPDSKWRILYGLNNEMQYRDSWTVAKGKIAGTKHVDEVTGIQEWVERYVTPAKQKDIRIGVGLDFESGFVQQHKPPPYSAELDMPKTSVMMDVTTAYNQVATSGKTLTVNYGTAGGCRFLNVTGNCLVWPWEDWAKILKGSSKSRPVIDYPEIYHPSYFRDWRELLTEWSKVHPKDPFRIGGVTTERLPCNIVNSKGKIESTDPFTPIEAYTKMNSVVKNLRRSVLSFPCPLLNGQIKYLP